MGVWPVGRLLASMAAPVMLSMLVQAFYNVVDSIFVARLSEQALTAVSLAFPLQNLIIAVGIGIAVGMNTLISRSLGEQNTAQANQAANTGLFLNLCAFVGFSVLGVTLSPLFFQMQTQNAEIYQYGADYASICLGCSVGIFCQFSFEWMLQATGRTYLTMCTQLTGAIVNIILDPILIFGLLGAPRLEVAGAAIATVIGQCAAAGLALFLNLTKNKEIHLSGTQIRWNTAAARNIFRVGFPTIVMTSIGSFMVFGLNRILIAFSTTAAAVCGAYFKLQSFIFMPVFGLNNSMVPIIAYNYGAQKYDRVRKTIRLAITASLCVMGAGTVLLECCPAQLLGLFSASPDMLAIGVPALRIIAFQFLPAGFSIIVGSVFQAIGNPMHSLIASICRQLVVLLPAAWLLAQTGILTLVWLALPISDLACLALSAYFFQKTRRTVLSL